MLTCCDYWLLYYFSDIFKVDPEYNKNEDVYNEIKRELLGDSDDDSDEDDDEEGDEGEGSGDEAAAGYYYTFYNYITWLHLSFPILKLDFCLLNHLC